MLPFHMIISIHSGRWTLDELRRLMDAFVVTLETAFAIRGLSLWTHGEMQFPTMDHDRTGHEYQYDLRLDVADEKHTANHILCGTALPVGRFRAPLAIAYLSALLGLAIVNPIIFMPRLNVPVPLRTFHRPLTVRPVPLPGVNPIRRIPPGHLKVL